MDRKGKEGGRIGGREVRREGGRIGRWTGRGRRMGE